MSKNFETLEVGREYLDVDGDVMMVAKHPYEDGKFMGVYKDIIGAYLWLDIDGDGNRNGAVTLIEPVEVVEYWTCVHAFKAAGVMTKTFKSLLVAKNHNPEGGDVLHTRLEYQNGVLIKSEVRSVKDE